MKRFGLVLFGALLCVAWHVGTLSVLPTSVTSSNHWQARQPQKTDARLGVGLKRFAVESRQFLGRSAQVLEEDSSQLQQEVKAQEFKDRRSTVRTPGHGGEEPVLADWHQPVSQPPLASTSPADHGSSGSGVIAGTWQTVQSVYMSVQPLAQAGWEGLQAGWRQFVASQMAANSSAESVNDTTRPARSGHGWRNAYDRTREPRLSENLNISHLTGES